MEKKNTAFFAAEYDEKILKTLPYYKEFIQQSINVVKAFHGDKKLSWLDVGCGTGTLAEKALKEISVEKFVLDDINEKMLSLAKERLRDTQADISYVQIPSENLNYKEEFNVVTSIQVHHYLTQEERKQATFNCYNALKKDGLYITFENYTPFSADGVQNGLERWRAYQMSQGRTLSEVEQHLKRFGVDYYPINVIEHIELIKEAGFRSVEIFWLTYMQVGLWAKK